ncbi:hypothetical protein [Paracoccus sp. MKU1]|uniref:hypothetical protein n=1 Tax=Paracoccus sp. MKU1 TaxID=1745182 RepID=UPI00128F1F58|nr:hypothetical protein [Paracoccus sp. MKU1]
MLIDQLSLRSLKHAKGLKAMGLEPSAAVRETSILVVSKDGDWRSFCGASTRLYLVSEIETALGLLNDPPLVVRQSILAWLTQEGDGRVEVQSALANAIIDLDVDVNSYAISGELEAIPYGAELRNVVWSEDSDIDIIETSDPDADGVVTAMLSMPLQVDLRVQVELNFSVWDSIDRESIGMGGRSVEVEEEHDLRTTVTIQIHNLGGNCRR